MVSIQSDSFEVGKSLKEQVRLSENAGAEFNPDLIIRYEQGNLSVGCKATDKARLAWLSKDCLIPVESQYFSLENECIVLNENADTGWSSQQQDIAHVMFSIFNQCEKINQAKQNSFWLSMMGRDELRIHICAARGFNTSDRRFLDISKTEVEQQQVIISNFFNSRVLSLTNNNTTNQRVIMSVVDYCNHNWRGSPFDIHYTPDTVSLRVNLSQPIPDTNECFVFYSTMDALDTYIKYGFVDLSAPVVRSVPLVIEITDIGRLDISGYIIKPANPKLLKNFRNIPRQVPTIMDEKKGEYIKISHIFIPDSNTPYAMKRVLAALLRRLSKINLDGMQLKEAVRSAEQQIVETNTAYYKKMELLADSELLKELASSQLSKIESYVRESM